MNKRYFHVSGMHCGGCKLAVEKQVQAIPWVLSVDADHTSGECWIETTEDPQSLLQEDVMGQALRSAVQKAGYDLDRWGAQKRSPLIFNYKTLSIWLGLIVLFGAVVFFSPLALPAIGKIPPSISYGALFGLGLVTSVHCIGMCGGINLSVTLTTKGQAWQASLAYNLGRSVGYTLVGALLGALGGVFSLSPLAKGFMAIAASILMLLMALKQVDLLRFIKIPGLIPKSLFNGVNRLVKPGSMPFAVGIANALMPCGPLQAMQLYALSTGSWWQGATGMFVFSLGTIPLMFAFGLSAATLGHKFNKPLRQASAVLLALLAVISLQRGLILTLPLLDLDLAAAKGLENPQSNPSQEPAQENAALPSGVIASVNGDTQEVFVEVTPFGYQDIVLQVGIPARVTFIAGDRSLTSCNEAIMIPEFEVQAGLAPGETTVTFTPTEIGDFPYSCWMGMIGNTIHVVAALPEN